ncbi:MAG: orotidine-5'-phosphate decarboxylase [Desulfobacterales bacterium]|nr:orotidine-5'-phosphate decarboxylase [Desulfobacterales bacterium]
MPKRTPSNYIIFPLDVPSVKEAGKYIDLLAGRVGMFKVGLELFIEAGPSVVRRIVAAGGQVFLDLKLHDIPATVGRAMARAADLGVSLATVHCGESLRMLEAAVAGADGKVAVLGVTVLTSVTTEDLRSAGFRSELSLDMEALVLHRANLARQAGCAGVVCSPLEVEGIKKKLGRGFLAVTPGVRPSWEAVAGDDQQRVATPASAVAAGADYLVIGRPIRDADDPAAAAAKIADEIAGAIP